MENKFEKVVAHMKKNGFVYQGSEIYGGLSNTWDFGPLGIEFKNNVKNAWWKKFIQQIPNNVGIQSAILMNPGVWKSSGHLDGFSDPLMDCKNCKSRHRADKLIEDNSDEIGIDGWSNEQMQEYIKLHHIACPDCGSHDFTEIRQFNLMFKTYQGVLDTAKNTVFLRPETAQGMFVNFKNVQRTSRKKIPFGIGQIGKSFRNEISPGNFIFRTREFEQMELEFFTKPGEDMYWYEFYQKYCMDFLVNLGVSKENLRLREHSLEELSHYSNGTCDIEYNFSFGWGELWGIANRTDFDLKAHQEGSKESLEYFDPTTNERYLPYTIEPSVGVERMMLTFMSEAYKEEELENDSRIVLQLHPVLAPFKAAILPLTKKISNEALEIFNDLSQYFNVDFDEAGSIGKRYRRQDEIGTPFCITFDFDSLEDRCVTIRNRDTMQQERIAITELRNYIEESLKF